MKRIVLISCVSQKLQVKAKAKDMYVSPLFKYSLKYAKSLNPDKIFILSAKYGLLDLEKEIDPYNETLSNISRKQREKNPNIKVLSKEERKIWVKKVIKQLRQKCDLDNDKIIFLAGKKYIENLTSRIKNYEDELAGKPIGKRVKFLKENTSK